MKISPPKEKGIQPPNTEKHPRPLILAFMLTGVLAVQAYPTFLKTAFENVGTVVSASSRSVASTSQLVSSQSNSSIDEQPINPIDPKANLITQTENSSSQKRSPYKVLPQPVFEPHLPPVAVQTPVELQVKLVNSDLHTQTPPPNVMNTLPPTVAEAVRQEISQETGISPQELTITEVERQTWPDSCLGLAQSDELCGQMLVEGWRVVLSNGRQTWTYRTDRQGQVVRLEQHQTSSNLPISVANRVFQDAANRSGLPHSALRIVEVQAQTWPDGCLGLSEPGTLCTLALVPGWQVKLASGREHWVYRTNQSGSLIRLDSEASHFNNSVSLRLLKIADSQLFSPRTQNWVWQAIAFCGITDTTYETLFGKTCNDRIRQNSGLF